MTETVIDVSFPSRRFVLSSGRADGNELTLFVPTSQSMAPGARVRLRCSFGDSDRRYELGGTVVFRRLGRGLVGQEEGVIVRFMLRDEKRAAAEMLAFCAGRLPAQGTSGNPRVVTQIRCWVKAGSQKYRAEVRDLSFAGAFVATPGVTLKEGTEVVLHLRPGLLGLFGTTLSARLMWSGSKNGLRGFGARFLGDPTRIRPALKKFLTGAPLARP